MKNEIYLVVLGVASEVVRLGTTSHSGIFISLLFSLHFTHASYLSYYYSQPLLVQLLLKLPCSSYISQLLFSCNILQLLSCCIDFGRSVCRLVAPQYPHAVQQIGSKVEEVRSLVVVIVVVVAVAPVNE